MVTARKPNDREVDVNVNVAAVHIHLHVDATTAADPRIAEILSAVKALTKGAQEMASSLDDLTAEVERNTSVDQSAIALLEGLKAKLDEAGTDPAALQALKDQLSSSSEALAAAVAANTPAEGGGDQPHVDNTLPGDL